MPRSILGDLCGKLTPAPHFGFDMSVAFRAATMKSLGASLMSLVLVSLLTPSCAREHRVLEVQRQVELLAKPYPLGYPSQNPTPNSIIKVLEPQRVTILSERYEKDFHVYKVRDSSHTAGYLIDQPGLREVGVGTPAAKKNVP
jgi:hypothetical protein